MPSMSSPWTCWLNCAMTTRRSQPVCARFTMFATSTATSRPRASSKSGSTRPSGEPGSSSKPVSASCPADIDGGRFGALVRRPRSERPHGESRKPRDVQWHFFSMSTAAIGRGIFGVTLPELSLVASDRFGRYTPSIHREDASMTRRRLMVVRLLLGATLLLASAANAQVTGDFNGDGRDDLAIGVPAEDIDGFMSAGAVHVIYGGTGGLNATGSQFWHQNLPGIAEEAEAFDQFGWALAAGDFDNDGFDDLAISAPADSIDGLSAAGAVHVLYGTSSGLSAAGDQLWHQNSPGIAGAAEADELFGTALTAGDFDGDGFDDSAAGVLGQDVGGGVDAGSVNVIYGSSTGLQAAGNQVWHQGITGINDNPENSDGFGFKLAAGDFDGDGHDDLAVGVAFETIGSVVSAGGVQVIYGSPSGLDAAGDEFWHQDSPNIAEDPETNNYFGYSLAVGDFDSDGRDDLAIGVTQ